MFKGAFLISGCVQVKYKTAPGNRLIFTFNHLGQPVPQFDLVVRLVGDIHVSLTAVNFTALGEAEMTAAMMLCNIATQCSILIKYRLYSAYLSDEDNFARDSSAEHEKIAHALFLSASQSIPEDMRIPFPKRIHERLHRPWLKGKSAQTSEQRLGLIDQPEPICPLIEKAVYNPNERDEIIALVHQLRDWGQSWKNLAKRHFSSM